MGERAFDLASFYARVHAPIRERAALRQDLVRGLKDYYESTYGYDRYAAETIFMLAQRMAEPYVYGFAVTRILRDRRLSEEVKVEAANLAVQLIAYGEDHGLPFGLYSALHFLASRDRLPLESLRFALVASAGEPNPFHGVEKAVYLEFFRWLLLTELLPPPEALFWAHSLIARHQDQTGASELIDRVMVTQRFAAEDRAELCRAWVHFRQPRLALDPQPPEGETQFVSERLLFWVRHAASWPTSTMVRSGLVWLARFGDDPLEIAETYIGYRAVYAEQIHSAIADILLEHRDVIAEGAARAIIEQGIAISGSIPTRRKFYRLGTLLFGPTYLEKARTDNAGSVRQWAFRELQK